MNLKACEEVFIVNQNLIFFLDSNGKQGVGRVVCLFFFFFSYFFLQAPSLLEFKKHLDKVLRNMV